MYIILQVDEEKEAKEKRVMDSLAWPVFLEQMKQDEGVEKAIFCRSSLLGLTVDDCAVALWCWCTL